MQLYSYMCVMHVPLNKPVKILLIFFIKNPWGSYLHVHFDIMNVIREWLICT